MNEANSFIFSRRVTRIIKDKQYMPIRLMPGKQHNLKIISCLILCVFLMCFSLNRTPRTKIRSKVMQISPLEPPAYQIDHEKAQKKEENVDGAQIGARSSHAAGEKGDDGKISRNSHLQSVFAKFCHHCGKTYPIATAKFCVWCGHERLVL